MKFVVCVNSIGNGLVIDPELEQIVIKPKGGFGGIGGDYIKPTALANVRHFYLLLREDIDIIGVGGAKTGMDDFEHLLCGAKAVQIGTEYQRKGADCFAQITRELKEILSSKGYQNIEEFRGKLKML